MTDKYTNATVRERLMEWADADYRAFSASLIPNVDAKLFIGVRLPKLRELAKQIARGEDGDWRDFLAEFQDTYFEETMLCGMVIGYIQADIEDVLRYTEDFVPRINNWSICDSFCTGLKVVRSYQARVWRFLQPYLVSEGEYEVRFAVVMLLNYYIDERYIEDVLDILDQIQHDGYYVKMAVAWAVSMCFVRQPERTLAYLRDNELDDFTYNKALQKIIESHQVDVETKQLIRGMKR